MDRLTIQIALTGISVSSAVATTATISVNIWAPPAFSVNLTIPFALGSVAVVGLILLSTTFLTSNDQAMHAESRQAQTEDGYPAILPTATSSVIPSSADQSLNLTTSSTLSTQTATVTTTTTSTAAPVQSFTSSVLSAQPIVRYQLINLTTINCWHQNVLERVLLEEERISLKTLLEQRGWQEVSGTANTINTEANVVKIKLVLILSSRLNPPRIAADQNPDECLYFYFRLQGSTPFTPAIGEFVADSLARESLNNSMEFSISSRRLIEAIEAKERWVAAQTAQRGPTATNTAEISINPQVVSPQALTPSQNEQGL